MPSWEINRHTGAKSIPTALQESTRRRVVDYAAKHCAGKFTRIDVRFRGAYCYIDGYTDQGDPPIHLCRLRYFGNPELWSFAFYTYAHEKYEPSFTMTGSNRCTPEEAFETSTLFY
jgi:hypothetical protein